MNLYCFFGEPDARRHPAGQSGEGVPRPAGKGHFEAEEDNQI